MSSCNVAICNIRRSLCAARIDSAFAHEPDFSPASPVRSLFVCPFKADLVSGKDRHYTPVVTPKGTSKNAPWVSHRFGGWPPSGFSIWNCSRHGKISSQDLSRPESWLSLIAMSWLRRSRRKTAKRGGDKRKQTRRGTNNTTGMSSLRRCFCNKLY